MVQPDSRVTSDDHATVLCSRKMWLNCTEAEASLHMVSRSSTSSRATTRLPLPIAVAIIGLFLAIAFPGGLGGTSGFLIGFIVGVVALAIVAVSGQHRDVTRSALLNTQRARSKNRRPNVHEPNLSTIHAWVASRLHTELDDLDPHVNLFEQGLSSIDVQNLLVFIRKNFGVEVEVRDIFYNFSVEGVVRLILAAQTNSVEKPASDTENLFEH